MGKEKFEKILKQVADRKGLTNYEIKFDTNNFGGDGFLSECQSAEISDKDTGTKIQTFVKISLPFLGTFTSWAYCNEYLFYSIIFPELNRFQTEKGVKAPFQNLPDFYHGNDKDEEKYIAMENLKIQNYIMTDKSQTINNDQLKALFKTYGKFHALSFAFKKENDEKYSEITKPLKTLVVGKEAHSIIGAAKNCYSAACNAIKEIDIEVYKKLELFKDKFEKIYESAATYTGKYSALSHGDCWSNNMLFKYKKNGKIEDIKIIDFQLCRDSTPVHDLSYFFYSGASKEDFKKLDEYLELYHQSFLNFTIELGIDAEEIISLSNLKSEWKKYSLYGIFMAVLLWQTKLINKDLINDFTTSSGQSTSINFELILQSDTFKRNASDILLHAVEYGII